MKVFESFKLGNLTLKNRIVMAPMTRSRAINNIPNQLMKTYYSQRAGAGLIVTEGTSPSPNGLGYPRIPGAFSDEQFEGWGAVAAGVHEQNGVIFVQLMHTGRVTAKLNLPEGARVIAPSAEHLPGEMYTDQQGMVGHETPQEMSLQDIEEAQKEYVDSAKGLIKAGIDGVELHSANGYLLDQFLNPSSNKREDSYGGDYQNRARFIIETAQKVADEIGSDKVGIRFSPYGVFNEMAFNFEDQEELFIYLAQELSKIGIAYIHLVDHTGMGAPEFPKDIKVKIKNAFDGTVIAGGNVQSADDAEKVLDDGLDLAYVGRPFIANPDLIEKFKNNSELVQPNMDTFYTPGEVGYTDY
ncbi:MAG: alkene reductase [Bacteroidota bacterium]